MKDGDFKGDEYDRLGENPMGLPILDIYTVFCEVVKCI